MPFTKSLAVLGKVFALIPALAGGMIIELLKALAKIHWAKAYI